MPSPTLYERVRNYVAKMPAAVSGQGGHDSTIHVACVLMQGFDLPRAEARQILDEYNARCAPPWSDRELEHKLNQADKMPGLQTRDGMMPRGCMAEGSNESNGSYEPLAPSRARSVPLPPATPVKATFQVATLKTFAARWRQYVDTAWLANRSPIAPRSLNGALSADDYLRATFRDGEKVVVFTNQRSQGQCLWPLNHLPVGATQQQNSPPALVPGDCGVWYLCQPVDGFEYPTGEKKDGKPKMSRRSAPSVTDWRYLILESDEADPRDWMAALVQLPLRVVSIYTSAKRSIHAKIRVDARSEGDWNGIVNQIRPIFVTLGADKKTMTAVRLTRLPGSWRHGYEDKKTRQYIAFPEPRLQKLLYLNPDPQPEPIVTLPPVRDVVDELVKLVCCVRRFSPEGLPEEDWQMVRNIRDYLDWYQSAPVVKPMLEEIETWMGGNH